MNEKNVTLHQNRLNVFAKARNTVPYVALTLLHSVKGVVKDSVFDKFWGYFVSFYCTTLICIPEQTVPKWDFDSNDEEHII